MAEEEEDTEEAEENSEEEEGAIEVVAGIADTVEGLEVVDSRTTSTSSPAMITTSNPEHTIEMRQTGKERKASQQPRSTREEGTREAPPSPTIRATDSPTTTSKAKEHSSNVL